MAHPARKGDSYHHGDLRRSLIGAALELIAEKGAEAFSLREVARRVGVSHTSVYQHFRDKTALLAAVGEEGYLELAKLVRSAERRARGDSLKALENFAKAYLRFAISKPSHFRVMSEPDLTRGESNGPLIAAHDEVFALLLSAVEHAQREGVLVAGDTRELALAIWTLVHGYAETYRAGRGYYRDPASRGGSLAAVERHFSGVFDFLLRGALAAARA
jgi:AcrR family transcriptional regulator